MFFGTPRGPYSPVQGFGLDVPYADAQGSTKQAHAGTGSLCSSDGNAMALQAMLADLGFYSGKLDGMMGTGTRGAVTAFAASQGIDPGTYFSTGSICQAIMDAWQAKKGAVAPSAPPATATPTAANPLLASRLFINPAIIAAFAKSASARSATTSGGVVAAPGSGITGWWSAQNSTTKIGIGVGAAAIVALGVYLTMGSAPRAATPNTRRAR